MKLRHCLLLIVAVAIYAPAQDSGSATASKIMAMEKAWNQAFKMRDTKAIDELLDDGAVLVNDDGSIQSKSDFLGWIHASKPSEEEQVSPESISVHVAGDVAIATGTFRAKGLQGGKTYSRQDRFVDTWVNRNGTWVCVSASATPVTH
jgi:ketosteroid isomerase-like protein